MCSREVVRVTAGAERDIRLFEGRGSSSLAGVRAIVGVAADLHAWEGP